MPYGRKPTADEFARIREQMLRKRVPADGAPSEDLMQPPNRFRGYGKARKSRGTTK